MGDDPLFSRDLLREFEAAGVFPWSDGGWGVDALLECQSRPHADLDVVIPESAVPGAQEVLTAAGFTVLRDWLPTALAMRHGDGREVDLHPIAPTEDGGGDQQRDCCIERLAEPAAANSSVGEVTTPQGAQCVSSNRAQRPSEEDLIWAVNRKSSCAVA